ncbi:MAG: hypothetical protein M3O34_12895 [Chloroflexota bacterium]|nr:hypothetical protein [Chloroflexota bacterium]
MLDRLVDLFVDVVTGFAEALTRLPLGLPPVPFSGAGSGSFSLLTISTGSSGSGTVGKAALLPGPGALFDADWLPLQRRSLEILTGVDLARLLPPG